MTNKITIINQTSEELDCSRLGIYTLKQGERVYAQTGPASMTKSEAEKQIAEILKQVELNYGCIVQGVNIKLIDISSIIELKHAAYVELDLLDVPNRVWSS